LRIIWRILFHDLAYDDQNEKRCAARSPGFPYFAWFGERRGRTWGKDQRKAIEFRMSVSKWRCSMRPF
jgi:hypothetical protein